MSRGVQSIAALAVAALQLACSSAPEVQPNLLLVTVDTLRADALECYGGPAGVGRAICSIAERGTRFRWALSTASYTAPSVASVLTSQYPYEHGVRQDASTMLRLEAETLAEALQVAGYANAAIVSNPVLALPNLDQGFDVFDLEMSRRERNRDLGEREAEATTDAALAWLATAGSGPWFLWVHYQDPHGPYEAPGGEAADDPPGALRLKVLPNESGYGGIPAYQALPGVFTRDAYTARYHEEVRYLDRHVGRLLDAVADEERPNAVLLTADHGEALGEDGFYFAHGHSVALDQVRVPLLLRTPEDAPAAIVDPPVSLIDVAPTLLELAGVDVPAAFRGRSLLDARGARPVYAESRGQIAIAEDGRYFAGVRGPGLPAGRAPRVAPLDSSDPLPPYRAVEDPPDRAGRLLADFLAAAAAAPPPPQHADVSEEQKARLRALGYVE